VSGPAERIEPLLAELEKSLAPGDFARVEELVRCVVALYGEGLARIPAVLAEQGAAGSALWRRLASDECIAGLLALHGLHPEPLAERVERALEKVRPHLGSHGGDVHLVSVDELTGSVRLRLDGTCDGCPASSATLRHLVSDTIRAEAPEVGEIAVDDSHKEQTIPLYTDCEL
jgi:Fe-S cluster biogenesis protein NfuA